MPEERHSLHHFESAPQSTDSIERADRKTCGSAGFSRQGSLEFRDTLGPQCPRPEHVRTSKDHDVDVEELRHDA
jgi:hypothetical protein